MNIFGDYRYEPIAPTPDNDTLAEINHRIMYRHLRNDERGVEVFMAPKGELNAGIVIGLVRTETKP